MKTKKFLLAIAVITFLGNAQLSAQETNRTERRPKIDMNELLERRCQRMEAQLSLDDATAAKFAPIYKEYMQELRAIHPHTPKCSKKVDRTDAERISNLENGFEKRQKMLDTQKKYYDKFKKILNARQLETIFGQHKHCADYKNRYGKRYSQMNKMKRYKNQNHFHFEDFSKREQQKNS